jgi:exodeoxyribonuclease-3
LAWLDRHQPDVLCLQETKVSDADFPLEEIEAAGYQVVRAGQKTYNGVAILSKASPGQLLTALPGMDDTQKRFLAATLGDVRVVNVYVPNGARVGSDKFSYKLDWLQALGEFLAAELDAHSRLALLGDFNIAPADIDVYDPVAWEGAILCSQPERDAFGRLLALGLQDAFRKFSGEAGEYSWWDYRAGAFRRNHGLRIDHILLSQALYNCCTACGIDREPRAWERPSDHAPVVAELPA